jgi:anthranilate synthase
MWILQNPFTSKAGAGRIRAVRGRILDGLPPEFTAGRYHSLFAIREKLPDDLVVTAEADGGVVMAIEHRTSQLAAVQFPPQSILTLADDVGLRLLRNVVTALASPSAAPAGTTRS